MTDLTENERRFLAGLEKLTRDTGVAVDGCGCCGSPYLTEIPAGQPIEAGYAYGRQLTWVSPEDDDWANWVVVSHQGGTNV
ncbi:hypothetical protein [Alloalcanivorax xenomutans]|uniref:hypothetical protein n=1 Tax=Alloalcanivorax xenomutans TaxID=1094342 RepID=UPI000479A47C